MDVPEIDRIEKALDSLLIQTKGEIYTRIEQVSFDVEIDSTQAKCHCYCLKSDGNGNLRMEDLVDYLDMRIVDYAIPKKEIDEANQYSQDTGSSAKFMSLRKKVQGLFTDLKKTGEGGEMLLYILAQEVLKLPQLISKMSLKTSGKLHYQGADGIHVSYDTTTDSLNLYWGESKMHKTIGTGISECFESLNGYLLDNYSYSSTQERDLDLITGNISSNVNDSALEDLLVRYFDKDDEFSNKLVYKGVCFIGYDYDKYPSSSISKTMDELKKEIETELIKHYKSISTNIKKYTNLDTKEIHVFLMPFPSVESFREYYLNTIK